MSGDGYRLVAVRGVFTSAR